MFAYVDSPLPLFSFAAHAKEKPRREVIHSWFPRFPHGSFRSILLFSNYYFFVRRCSRDGVPGARSRH